MGIVDGFIAFINRQKTRFNSSKSGATVADYMERDINFKVKHLLPPLKWAGIAAGAFILDAAVLGAVAAGMVNFISDIPAKMKGLSLPDPAGPAWWYLLHPFKVSWIFLRHMLGAPINVTPVYNTWIGLNAFCAVVVVGVFAYKKYAALKDKRTEAGTSEFVEPGKVKEIFSYKYGPGIMFGGIGDKNLKPVILRPEVRSNLNVMVFGPPGSGKSATYIKNNIMQAVASGWSIVVTDPKGEMVKEFAVWLEKQGYFVKIFNLKEMTNSDRWNPLSEVHDGISAQDFCDVVIASTSAPARKGGDKDFWATAELNLLKALVLYVVKELPPGQRNLGELYKMLASGDSKQLDQVFSVLPSDHPAKMPYNLFCEATGVVRTGVIMGLGNRLGIYQEKLVRELTAVYGKGEAIDLKLPGKQKCAYFCVMPDSRGTFDFLASLFFSFFFIDLMDLADSNESCKLDVPVNFLLDEFCNIPGIPDFTKKLSTMRSRGIACSIIVQNIPQLEQSYPNKQWEVILGDCDYWLMLGTKELSSSKYMSEIIGPTTIEVERDNRPKGLKGIGPFAGSTSTSPTKRMLLDSSEVGRLNPDEAILRIADGRILKFKKMYYKNHPFAVNLEERHISKYMPAWAVEYARLEVPEGWDEQSVAQERETERQQVVTMIDDERAETGQQASTDGPSQESGRRDTFWG